MRSFVPRSAGPWLAVLTLTAAGTAAAAGYGLTAPKRYRATAQLLVSPVAVSDPVFTGLDVLRDTGGRRTAAASAAALLRSPQVADQVRAELGLQRSRDSLLNALHSHVVDSSDVVAVTVEDTSAAGAAQLANAFADALVKQRTAGFQSQLAATIRRDTQLLDQIAPANRTTGAGAALDEELTTLHSFEGQPDPTIRHAGEASAPASASWPKLPRLAATGAVAGLAAGLLVALLLALGRRKGAAPYDRGVSDRLAERLEQRLAERIAALEAEHERLAGREAALAARERDIDQKLGELREASAESPPPVESGEREAALEQRVQALAQRELALARRVAEATAQKAALEARSAELERRAEELAAEAAQARAQAEQLVRAAAAQAQAEQLVRAAEPEPARVPEPPRAPEPERVPEPPRVPEPERVPEPPRAPESEPEPEPAAPPVRAAPAEPSPGREALDETSGRWNLLVLERLINERGAEFPERVEEWASYLYFLREYAEPDGSLPASFDWLIEDTFAELIA